MKYLVRTAALAGRYHIERELGQVVVGYADGYSGLRDPDIIRRINQSEAEVLLVALGNPLQEEWILTPFTGAGNLNKDVLRTDVERLTAFYYDNGYVSVKVGDASGV